VEGVVTVDAECPFWEALDSGDFCLLCRLPTKGFAKQQRLTQGDGTLFEVANAHVLL
jgi:hypothetical protein